MLFLFFMLAIAAPVPRRTPKFGSPVLQPNGSWLVVTVPKTGTAFKGF